MAIADLTNTPIALITSDAVVRGIHTTTIKIDLSLNTTGAIDDVHTIYELPAGAALLPASAGYITTILAGGLASSNFRFKRGANDLGYQGITGEAVGTGFALGPAYAAAGSAGAYDAAVSDITLTLAAAATSGVIVLVLVWADIGNALSAGYREGDGTV